MHDAHYVHHGEDDTTQDKDADVQVRQGDEHHNHDAEEGQAEVREQLRCKDLLNLPWGINSTVDGFSTGSELGLMVRFC